MTEKDKIQKLKTEIATMRKHLLAVKLAHAAALKKQIGTMRETKSALVNQISAFQTMQR